MYFNLSETPHLRLPHKTPPPTPQKHRLLGQALFLNPRETPHKTRLNKPCLCPPRKTPIPRSNNPLLPDLASVKLKCIGQKLTTKRWTNTKRRTSKRRRLYQGPRPSTRTPRNKKTPQITPTKYHLAPRTPTELQRLLQSLQREPAPPRYALTDLSSFPRTITIS